MQTLRIEFHSPINQSQLRVLSDLIFVYLDEINVEAFADYSPEEPDLLEPQFDEEADDEEA